MKRLAATVTVAGLLTTGAAAASEPGALAGSPVSLLFGLGLLSLGAILLMMVTSFVKVVVVLSILRNAIGTQQIPPTPVIHGLALILTLFIMNPVFNEAVRAANLVGPGGEIVLPESSRLLEAVDRGREPLREFLKRHAHEEDRRMFYELANQMQKLPESSRTLNPDRFQVLIPAFVTSELAEAFAFGFMIYLPFLIIDLVVANILMGMGMAMMSPTVVSLPFKLLLFVLVNGWANLIRALATDYLPRL